MQTTADTACHPIGRSSDDANGNTLSDAQGRNFTWDFENRLTQAVVPGTSGGTTTFRYDPFGRRIQKSGPLGTTNYLYDGPTLVLEVNDSGSVFARYAPGWNLDEPLSESLLGSTSYYAMDGLGSVTSLSNSAGTLADSYAYDSFGKLVTSSGTLINRFQYAAREFDAETGLYQNRARAGGPAFEPPKLPRPWVPRSSRSLRRAGTMLSAAWGFC